jgi:hypothetical protein
MFFNLPSGFFTRAVNEKNGTDSLNETQQRDYTGNSK